MNWLDELKKELSSSSATAYDGIPQELHPRWDVAKLYAHNEVSNVTKRLKKLVAARKEKGVNYGQLSDLEAKVIRSFKAVSDVQKRVKRFEDKLAELELKRKALAPMPTPQEPSDVGKLDAKAVIQNISAKTSGKSVQPPAESVDDSKKAQERKDHLKKLDDDIAKIQSDLKKHKETLAKKKEVNDAFKKDLKACGIDLGGIV